MKNPISTYTNLAYVVAGLFYGNSVIGLALILLGVASFLYHSTEDGGWQSVDVIGIYLVLNLFMGWELTESFMYMGFYAIPLTIFLGIHEEEMDTFKVVPLLFFQIAILKFFQGDSMWFLAPFLSGGTLNLLGIKFKEREDELHGGWHLLTALGFYLI